MASRFLFKIDHMAGNVVRLIFDRGVLETIGKKALERSAACDLRSHHDASG